MLTPRKTIELYAEAHIFNRMCELLPKDFPGVRELIIQTDKLKRMVRENPKRLSSGTSSSAKARKESGKRAEMVFSQHRRVRSLVEQSFKEFFRQQDPKITNKQFQQWRGGFDRGIKQFADDLIRETDKIVLGSLPPALRP
jgi:hypothetical protein